MNNHHYCIIMAGGVGSRFWPISKESKPKQFLDFTRQGVSFLTATYERFAEIVPKENILVVSLARYRDQVLEHVPELPEQNLLLEPYGRNTAPCIAFATYSILKRDPQAVTVVTPADHIIRGKDLFDEAIRHALDYASEHRSLITLGVEPTRADTNFGYIQMSDPEPGEEDEGIVKVKTFTEKPDAELAEVFVQSGEFLWNSGIFVWQADVIREEMEKHIPQIARQFRGWQEWLGAPSEKAHLERAYARCNRDSIDYGVMEKTDCACVYPVKFSWADIGNWSTMYEYLSEKDDSGNVINAQDSLVIGSKDSMVYTTRPDKLVAVSGLEGYVVIDTDDVLMICPRDDKRIKEVTSNIRLKEYEKYR